MRTIRLIINSYLKPVDTGFPVTSPLPSQTVKQISPFIMLEHQGPNTVMPGQKVELPEQNYPGVDRISLLFEGNIEYQDRFEKNGVLKAGDMQWLTALPGTLLTEKIHNEAINEESKFHLVQIWIDLPKDFLLRPLRYQDIKKEDIPEITGDGFKLRIIAGEQNGINSPVSSFSPVSIIHGIIQAGKGVSINLPKDFNACLYITLGEIKILGEKIESRKLIWFNNDDDNIWVAAASDCEFLLLSGKSLEQTMAQYYTDGN
jgi:redox-sensitive bicupin YhaK (pirin superfamily)